ncbi:GNAT family N-acetyltransferase/peptidase C39 family protein [Glaciecola sp. MH2013]|uniref:GNAT family N-acetyltransferase/peptidase C39 family protein n=1 Tax=Glaciecola sp. MH2013 TaxID=2785524 RepID=UPI0018A0CBF6|nr:GNAT family N-acetyltransferase/peptidase C39 family protein [Glaciecola sp. MH2013]MBF7074381.1 GNAT family N-acetyltransferase/peptidase C39 family protein [Glaciecola sp. MH2013]
MNLTYRLAQLDDLPTLVRIENHCFQTDRLSKRRFKHWILAANGICVVAIKDEQICGYGLVILRNGTRSARLYSLALESEYRGLGIAQGLLLELERLAVSQQRLFMRLEVAENNLAAIKMYQHLGYKQFGVYQKYYADGTNALRLQKPIKQSLAVQKLPAYPWYQQSTEFTCGPAALMMAMHKLNADFQMSAPQEIDIWRQATTVFMTSGHGGCHPVGLALAAKSCGFDAQVYLSQAGDLFVEGVRSEHKKSIMQLVEKQFFERATEQGVSIHYYDSSINNIENDLAEGHAVICLISTYQFDGKKAPHWVAITHIDDTFLYLHDPDASVEGVVQAQLLTKSEEQLFQSSEIDYQHVPILKEDFTKFSVFGKRKLRTCLVIKNKYKAA